MRPEENIENLIKSLHFKASTESHNRTLNDVLEAHEKSKKTKLAELQPNIWRTIMKSKIAKLAAAAALVVIVGVLGYWSDTSVVSKVYAMSDVPQLFYSANTIHMKGRMYFPASQPGNQQVSIETQYWLDLANGRWRLTKPSYSSSPEGMKITVSEDICDGGEYEITLNHTEDSASYNKVSEYQRQLFNRRNIHAVMTFAGGQPELFDHFEIVGEEKIDGHTYNIWEAFVKEVRGPKIKMRSWLSPATGDFARVILWMQQEDEDWLKRVEIDYIERDIEIPEEIFLTEVPSGYTLENTKDTANKRGLTRVKGRTASVSLAAHVLFTMADGTVVACWSSEDDESEVSQPGLFENLVIGGQLPKLPFEVYVLKSSRDGEDITYSGYHLAYTKKADKFYEWGIYLPPEEFDPAYTQLLSYLLEYRHNIENREVRGKLSLSTAADLIIENQKDFDTFVRGAMAELSGDGKTPDEVTYENVLRLVQQIRESSAE
jgi:predicted ribosomally synthesized peptide with SipW-like signal peptide